MTILPEQLNEVDKRLSSQDEHTRWQAAIALGEFCETDAEAIWPLTVKYGSCSDEDTRTAIATCVLEHILEYHFDSFFSRVRHLIQQGSRAFAHTFSECWQFGQAKMSGNSEQFESLHRQAAQLSLSLRRKRKTRAVMARQRSKREWRRERNSQLSQKGVSLYETFVDAPIDKQGGL